MTANPETPQQTLAHLLAGGTLDERRAREVFERVLGGGFDEAQIGSLLALIASRGPTVDELVGGARAMRQHVSRVELPEQLPADARVIDTCGTGGAAKTFNVSTVAAFVVAAAGQLAERPVYVAKHGSLSRTGRGSAEVLEKLGVNVHAEVPAQRKCLTQSRVCFCFSVRHHPAMKHAAGPRKSLGFPTIFNLLGPLTNPAGVRRQLLGTYSAELAEKMARTLQRLGVERAIVVHSHDGMDELSTTSTNVMHDVHNGTITTRVIDPQDLGLARTTVEELQVASLDEAAESASACLDGQAGAKLDMVLLNAAGGLLVAEAVGSIAEGLALARKAAESGGARACFERFAQVSRGE